jgi:hypothetical protein
LREKIEVGRPPLSRDELLTRRNAAEITNAPTGE